jgi:hypothetical protein
MVGVPDVRLFYGEELEHQRLICVRPIVEKGAPDMQL